MAIFTSIGLAAGATAATAAATGAAIVGAGIAGVGLLTQTVAARKSASAQEQANRAARGQAETENRRRRLQIIRQQQQAAAQAENVQATQGGGGVTTSMAHGALVTASTQGQINLGDFGSFASAGRRMNSAQLALGRAQSLANTGAALTQFGNMFLNNASRTGSFFAPKQINS